MPTAIKFCETPSHYVPADLRHDTNGWYITYYEFSPIANALIRKRIRLNMLRKRCKTMVEFKVQVNDIISTINTSLSTCSAQYQAQITEQKATIINYPTLPVPEDNSENIRYYTTLEQMIDLYLEEKQRDSRDATFRSYKSGCKAFKTWCSTRLPSYKCIQFRREHAVEYLDELLSHEGISNRTYNNNLKMMRALFSWAQKKCYVKENHFAKQETKRVLKKKRTIIPTDARQLIDNYFREENPAMRIIMRMVYTSLLRPVEISRVQVHQLDFVNHCIHMPGDKTKNWEARDARMDKELEDLLREHIAGSDKEDYLFADRQWKCGKKTMLSHSYSKAWEDMRRGLVDMNGEQIIPDSYQLYSLKDTSINGMIKGGVDDLSVMQAAGHKDLKMTQIYADHFDPKLIANLNQKAPAFRDDR